MTSAVIITSINPPTRAVLDIAAACTQPGRRFIVIGDEKSPPDFAVQGCDYYDIAAQRRLGLAFGEICPTRHYARKNIGYLAAMQAGADTIVETDDDNIPLPAFWDPRTVEATAPVAGARNGWVNVYAYFTEKLIWPRGLPLDRIQDSLPALGTLPVETRRCPIQQGLADANPDVDAIYRLVLPLPLDFEPGRTVILDKGAWCPFNSQNTTWWPEAYPLLYLPFHCSFRMTDIWRSFVAQRIAWENGWSLLFHSSTVFQERNEHNLMRDFADEVPGYLHNQKIIDTLEGLDLSPGVDNIPDNLARCYDALIGLEVVGREEAALVRAWNADIERIRRADVV